MMPFCEYRKCKRVADTTQMGLLRKWDSYSRHEKPTHSQDIALCHKHLVKINELLDVRYVREQPHE